MASKNAEMAKNYFENDEFNEEVEKSALSWGGEEDEPVKKLSGDDTAKSRELLKHVYIVSREKYKNDPESLSTVEMIAAKFAQKPEGEEFTPKEQAELYTTLKTLELEIDDEENPLAEKMRLVNEDGTKNEQGHRYLAEMEELRREIFLNLTGFDAAEELGEYSEESMRQWLKEEEMARVASYGKTVKASVWLKNKVRHGVDILGWKGSMSEEEVRAAYDEELTKRKNTVFGQKAEQFKPEERINQLAVQSLENTKTKMVDYAEKYLLKRLGEEGYPTNSPRNKDQIEFRVRQIESATTLKELDRNIEQLETLLESTGSSKAKELVFKAYERYSPDKSAEELALEEMVAEEMDALAQEALRRELPADEAGLNQMINRYGSRIKELEKLDAKSKTTKEQKAELKELKEKLPLAREALEYATNDEKVEEVMSCETVEDFEDLVPGDKKRKTRFENHLARKLNVDTKGLNATAKKKALNKAMKNKTKFSLGSVFFAFIKVELNT